MEEHHQHAWGQETSRVWSSCKQEWEASGSKSSAIRSYPSNQKSTWFKLASLIKPAQHQPQFVLNGCEISLVILFPLSGWCYSPPEAEIRWLDEGRNGCWWRCSKNWAGFLLKCQEHQESFLFLTVWFKVLFYYFFMTKILWLTFF